MSKFVDITGKKFGRLTVVERVENSKSGNARWLCRCDCGSEKIVRTSHLRAGKTKSCGCIHKEIATERAKLLNASHRISGTRLYRIRENMITRCYYKKDKRYKDYGGRGIRVCDEWKDDREKFFDWAMQNGYSDELTLDRINVNGNYEPSNCRWVSRKEQGNNRRTNHLLTYNGKTQTLMQWANEMKINYRTLCTRINAYHWTPERALTEKTWGNRSGKVQK